jgi:hypothetical protein
MAISKFFQLLAGLGPETPLGRIVEIRSEDNKDIIKNYSSSQLKIRQEWEEFKNKTMKPKSEEDIERMYDDVLKMFESLM